MKTPSSHINNVPVTYSQQEAVPCLCRKSMSTPAFDPNGQKGAGAYHTEFHCGEMVGIQPTLLPSRKSFPVRVLGDLELTSASIVEVESAPPAVAVKAKRNRPAKAGAVVVEQSAPVEVKFWEE